MVKLLVMLLVNVRWAYFHAHPRYMKFYIDSERKEAHFQDRKTGQLHSNLVWVDEGKDDE